MAPNILGNKFFRCKLVAFIGMALHKPESRNHGEKSPVSIKQQISTLSKKVRAPTPTPMSEYPWNDKIITPPRSSSSYNFLKYVRENSIATGKENQLKRVFVFFVGDGP